MSTFSFIWAQAFEGKQASEYTVIVNLTRASLPGPPPRFHSGPIGGGVIVSTNPQVVIMHTWGEQKMALGLFLSAPSLFFS